MVYIHVPFCRRKCLYCDFFSVGEPRDASTFDAYARGITAEIRARREELAHPLTTIYIGGGTPSLLPFGALRAILDALAEVSGSLDSVREFTLEVNPDDVTPEKIEAWKSLGINRISMGVQSLLDEELRAVGRRHTAAQAVNAAQMLTEAFGNVSLDLIFGLPGQTLDSLRESLTGIIVLKPKHISVYSLTYEEGTPLTRLRDRGLLTEASEETSLLMFGEVRRQLCEAGFDHYEISNFARPGFRSLHNSSYWRGVPYVGLGPGAHSYDGQRTRRANPASKECLTTMDWHQHPSIEVLTDEELREEYVMTRLRTREGLDLEDFRIRFGEAEAESLLRRARNHQDRGSLLAESNHLHLTSTGIMLSDNIILDLA